MPQIKDEEEDNNNDLIAMNSPSSRSQPQNRTKTKIEVEDDLAIAEQRAAFEEKMAKKESQGQELDKMSKNLSDELRLLQSEVRIKRESEEQMKQVLKEYEKTISELIAEKEREKATYEEDKLKLCAERDQATEDLKVRPKSKLNFQSTLFEKLQNSSRKKNPQKMEQQLTKSTADPQNLD